MKKYKLQKLSVLLIICFMLTLVLMFNFSNTVYAVKLVASGSPTSTPVPTPTPLPTPCVPVEITPTYKFTEILLDADPSGIKKYCVFPSTIKLSDTKVLSVYKRGDSHYMDDGDTELIIYNPSTELVTSRTRIHNSTLNDQSGDLNVMPNGDLVIYIDTHSTIDTQSSMA